MKKIIIIPMAFFMLWFTIHTMIIVIDGLKDEISEADVGVVLGNKVELNGAPSKRLQARLDKAAELYKQGKFSYIIVSGGIGIEGFDEAIVMKEYLVELGIPDDKIITDSNGYNTQMTAENSKDIMDELGLDSVIVITQYHHITRTKLAFRNMGYDMVYSAHAEIFEVRDIYSIVREFIAYYKYILKG